MSTTNKAKTKTALEVKTGDQVMVKGLEFWVECSRVNDDHQVTLWGAYVIKLGASEAVIVTNENWGE
jgi:hypothetical protein